MCIDKIKLSFKRTFPAENIHSWIVPLLHAALWATALFFAQNVIDFFPKAKEDTVEIVQFSAVFVVLFVEILVVLIDVYVVNKANYLAAKFILFVVALFAVLLCTVVSVGIAAVENVVASLPWVLFFSSMLKLLENLLINNIQWYVVSFPVHFDAQGVYINHPLNVGSC